MTANPQYDCLYLIRTNPTRLVTIHRHCRVFYPQRAASSCAADSNTIPPGQPVF